MSEPLLRVEGLSKSFPTEAGPIHVLREVSLDVDAGESVAILGQSGVGKSTLLHLLGALDQPSSGRVLVDGEDLFAKTPQALASFRNEVLGFVFQFHHLLPEFSAVENVMMPGLLRGMQAEAIRERAAGILREVDLDQRIDHPVGKLSGGERQRVAVARALVMQPRLVLADEPTGNLDPHTGERVADLLLELNRSRGTALVVVSHSEVLAARLDTSLVLSEGGLRSSRAPVSAAGPLPDVVAKP